MSRKRAIHLNGQQEIEFWKTKDGEQLKISEMTIDHIKNCIKFIQSKLNAHSITKTDTFEKHLLFYKDRYEDLPEPPVSEDYLWTLQYGYAYLDRFNNELKLRAIRHSKHDKQDWVLEYMSRCFSNTFVDIYNETFVDEYINKFNPKKIGWQPYGANTVPELGRLLSDMYKCNMLNRTSQGIGGMSRGDGFAKWVYVYSVKKHQNI